MTRTLVVLAKAPRPGRVKTRLCPPLTLTEAAHVAGAALADTLAAARATDCRQRVLALDDVVADLPSPGFRRVRQAAGELADRLAALFGAIGGPLVLMGTDTPQATPAQLDDAFAQLIHPDDAVLGLADDGGFWLIGMRRPDSRVFAGVAMSTEETGAAQDRRLRALGYRVHHIEPQRDVDEWPDALAVARAAPHTMFAATVATLSARVDVAPDGVMTR